MRRNRSANTFVITASMLVTWSGCAYMNSTGLDDIIPAAPTQQFSDDRQLLSDLKVDPLASSQFAEQFKAKQSESEQFAAVQQDDFVEQTSAELPISLGRPQDNATEFPVAPKSAEVVQIRDATPVLDPDDVTPIILKAVKRSSQPAVELPQPQPPLQEITVQDLPMLPLENTGDLPMLEATTANSMDAIKTTPQLSNIVTDPQFAEPLLPTPQHENRLLPVPINEAPEARSLEQARPATEISMAAIPAAPEQAALPDFESDFDEFISDQMQFLVPPFAEHPVDIECTVDNCEQQMEDIVGTELSEDVIDFPDFETEKIESFDNDFVVENRSTNDASNESHEVADNYFSGSRIPAETENTIGPEIETTSAALPGLTWPKTDPNTAPVIAKPDHEPLTNDSEKISWQGQLDRTIETFEDEIASAQDDVEAENLESGLTMLKALRNRMSPDDGSPEEMRNYWTHQIETINRLLNQPTGNHDSRVAAVALDELRLAVHQLQIVADLKVFNAVICKSVSGYGQYIPFANNEFVPRQTILVYCEIDNFAPLLKTVDGVTSYRTQLSSSFTIRNSDGTVVQHQDFPVVTDNARNLRRDFFMHLPVTLAEFDPGIYELQVGVRDHGSDKSAELKRSLKLTIR